MLNTAAADTSASSVRHLPVLDSLRGLAILGVVMVHSVYWYLGILPTNKALMWVAFTGQRGVQMFFLVSAFTLTLSHYNRRQERRPTLNYAIRRFFRIAPMLYLGILLTHLLLPQQAGPVSHVILAAVFVNGLDWKTVTHGTAGGWTIADEALFYFVLPLLLSFLRSLKAAFVFMVASGVAMFVVSSFLSMKYRPFLPSELIEYIQFTGFPVEFPIFVGGIVIYFVWRDLLLTRASSVTQSQTISLALLFLAGTFYIGLLPFTNSKLYPTSMVCALVFVALLIYPWSLLINSWTQWLGKISYSIYILHFFVMKSLHDFVQNGGATGLLRRPGMQAPFYAVVTLLATTPAAYLTWRVIEEPGRKLGSRLIRILS